MSAVQNCVMGGSSVCWEAGEWQSAEGGPNFLPSPHVVEGVDTGLFLLFLGCSMCLQPLNFFGLRAKFSKTSHRASNKNYSLAWILLLCLTWLSGIFHEIWNKMNLIWSGWCWVAQAVVQSIDVYEQTCENTILLIFLLLMLWKTRNNVDEANDIFFCAHA